MIGTSSLCAVIAGISIVSADVRMQIANVIAGDPAGEVSAMTFRVLDFGRTFAGAAADYRAANAPLVGFGIAAVVLTIVMFRT